MNEALYVLSNIEINSVHFDLEKINNIHIVNDEGNVLMITFNSLSLSQ